MKTPHRHLRRALRPSVSAFLLSAACLCSVRADVTWTGTTDQSWNTLSNWSGDPDGQNIVVNTATGNYPVISSDPSFTPVDVLIGAGAGQSGQLDQSAGLLQLANTGTAGYWFFVGRGGGTGVYNVTGSGSALVGKLWIGGEVYDENGNGTVTVNTTGSVTANSTQDFTNWGQIAASIIVGWGTTGQGTLNLQNGTVNANGGMFVGAWGSTGTVNQTGGVLNTTDLNIGRWYGTGVMNVTNGTVNASGSLRLAAAGAAIDQIQGTLNVNGGSTVNIEGDLVLAFAGNSTSSGTLNIATGGVVNVGTSIERWLIVNQWDTVQGTLNVDGGTLNLNANSDLRFSTGNGTGASVVNLNSGAITSWSGNGTGDVTTGVVDLNNAGGAGANNTFNLNGGTLTVNQIITSADAGTATFNFNGGTLKAAGNSANFVDLGGAGQSAVVKAGGAIIDTNGFDVTVPQALVTDGNGGGLTKIGAGTLTLAGANTYTGPTTINNGVLALSGSILSTQIAFTLTNSTFGQLSVLDPSFSFAGEIRFNLAGVSSSNSWTLFIGGEFGAGDLNPSAVTSDLGTFSTAGGNTWTFSNGSGSWSFDGDSGALTFVAVPEPGTTALLGLALLACGGFALRRRAQRC